MQVFRRLYATIPDAAAVARTASTPRAVRLRRQKKGLELKPGHSDATPEGLTPSELARYKRQRAKGDLLNADGSEWTEGQWLERLNSRRSRLRGVRHTRSEGDEEALEQTVVAQKIYLPNLIFRLVRNFTPPGQPYNPYEATFRVPQSTTKTDVRSYLSAVYGVQTTYIRTDNYLSPRDRLGARKQHKTYKRAVVGLVEPFYYPQAIEDMTTEERDKLRSSLDDRFSIDTKTFLRKYELLRLTKKGSMGWKWRTEATASRGNILRLIAERRAMREELIMEAKSELAEARQKAPSDA